MGPEKPLSGSGQLSIYSYSYSYYCYYWSVNEKSFYPLFSDNVLIGQFSQGAPVRVLAL